MGSSPCHGKAATIDLNCPLYWLFLGQFSRTIDATTRKQCKQMSRVPRSKLSNMTAPFGSRLGIAAPRRAILPTSHCGKESVRRHRYRALSYENLLLQTNQVRLTNSTLGCRTLTLRP